MATKNTIIPIKTAGDMAGLQAAAGGCSSATSSCASSCSSASSCGSAGGNSPEDLLRAQGWILRTTISEPRLSEVVENYKAMGYEVHVERFGDVDAGEGGCTTCYDATDKTDDSKAWGAVYVRPSNKPPVASDELF